MYLIAKPALYGCGCPCNGKGTCAGKAPKGSQGLVLSGYSEYGPRPAMSRVASPMKLRQTWSTSVGAFDCLGDVGGNPIVFLQQELNRFVTPTQNEQASITAWRFATLVSSPLPVTGVLDGETARRAMSIAQLRAAEVGDQELANELNTAATNPTLFVKNNVGRLNEIVRLFGDQHKVAPAQGRKSPYTPLVIAGIAAAGIALAMFAWSAGAKKAGG